MAEWTHKFGFLQEKYMFPSSVRNLCPSHLPFSCRLPKSYHFLFPVTNRHWQLNLHVARCYIQKAISSSAAVRAPEPVPGPAQARDCRGQEHTVLPMCRAGDLSVCKAGLELCPAQIQASWSEAFAELPLSPIHLNFLALNLPWNSLTA